MFLPGELRRFLRNMVQSSIAGVSRRPLRYPYLPADFLRRYHPGEFQGPVRQVFLSSGTTRGPTERVRHYWTYPELYEVAVVEGFRWWSRKVLNEDPERIAHLVWFPAPSERRFSSLLHMLEILIRSGIQRTKNVAPSFWFAGASRTSYPDFHRWLEVRLSELPGNVQAVILWLPTPVLFRLLQKKELEKPLPSELILMETGGMKRSGLPEVAGGELLRIAVRQMKIRGAFSEYGMCELGSQAYTLDSGSDVFGFPPWVWMETMDPRSFRGRTGRFRAGRLCIADPVRVDSWCFVETGDMGILQEEPEKMAGTGMRFRLLGRWNLWDVRGCHMLWEAEPDR